MLSIETDDILFEILNASTVLKAQLSGGIYVQGERPDDSEDEDIVINCLYLSHDIPQSGTSNVNIHVPDKKTKIRGKEQRKADRERLRLLTSLVLAVLKSAKVTGLTINVANETVIKEPDISQHYNNLRIDWNIHLTD